MAEENMREQTMRQENMPQENMRQQSVRPENISTSPDDARERRLEAGLPVEERAQPDPALQLTTGRLGATGWAIFALIAIVVLSAVLYGLNGPSETSSQTRSQSGATQNNAAAPNTSAPNTSAEPNTSSGPTPTAPQTGPGGNP
jgi:hypothetical protein